jgi:hypothetical protein
LTLEGEEVDRYEVNEERGIVTFYFKESMRLSTGIEEIGIDN